MRLQSSGFRTWHRWLGLFVGIQMVLWVISGAYMVFVKLPFIHGVHLTQEADIPLNKAVQLDRLNEIITQYPAAHDIQFVRRYIGGDYHELAQIHDTSNKFLVRLDDLSVVELENKDIRGLAERYYKKGVPNIAKVEFLTTEAPSELNPAHLPIWRVDFDDFADTSLYLHRNTGEMTVRRHDFWRGFDIMWMLHIMDYEERTNITTWWLRAFIIATFGFIFTGVILVIQTLRSSKRKPL